eukprot:scaffold72403_cov111-Phaeocystis_antarctica.AAC.2
MLRWRRGEESSGDELRVDLRPELTVALRSELHNRSGDDSSLTMAATGVLVRLIFTSAMSSPCCAALASPTPTRARIEAAAAGNAAAADHSAPAVASSEPRDSLRCLHAASSSSTPALETARSPSPSMPSGTHSEA